MCPNLRKALFKELRPGYLSLAVDKSAIKTTIYEHPEFVTFRKEMEAVFTDWRDTAANVLNGLEKGFKPKAIIAELSESLLVHYASKPLIAHYDVYQHIMEYWEMTMKDDCYILSEDGWVAETRRIIEKDKKGKEKDKGWTCDLIPKELVISRYFVEEQAALEKLVAKLESISSQSAELLSLIHI